MLTEEDRATRLAVVRRIAVGMANRSDDPVLAKTQILTKSSFVGTPKSIEELDGRNPVATQSDGGRFYPHVRMDGRGQIDIVWPSGVEMTYKFLIPEEYLMSEATAPPPKPNQSQRLDAPATPPASQVSSQLDHAIERIQKVDSSFPLSIAHIPKSTIIMNKPEVTDDLQAQINESMDRIFGEIESGKISEETVERLKRGRAILSQQASPANESTSRLPASKADQLAERLTEIDPSFPPSISSIPDFPCRSFEELKSSVRDGRLTVERYSFAIDTDLFELVTSPGPASALSFSIIATFSIPVLSILFAVFFSAWFMIGLLYFFIGRSITKRIYADHLIAAALEAERKFCILYHSYQIRVRSPTLRRTWTFEPTSQLTQLPPRARVSPAPQSSLKTSVGVLIPGDTSLDPKTEKIFGLLAKALSEASMGKVDKFNFPMTREITPGMPPEPWGRIGNCEVYCNADEAFCYLANILRQIGSSPYTTLIITRDGKDDTRRIDQIAQAQEA